MAITVETLEKLERKITLTLVSSELAVEVEKSLKKIAKQVKVDGFRPGKAPMAVVNQRYAYSTHYEVLNEKVGMAFEQAVRENNLRVAGQPSISEKDGEAAEGKLHFDAKFEVFPEVQLGNLSAVTAQTVQAEIDDAAIDRTIDILRKQRQTFAQRASDDAAVEGDRVSVDFAGKIDGEAFEGGSANDFVFTVGGGQMLKEFDEAVRGMKTGQSKTFPLNFPADYHGKDVAGKEADFLVTVRKVEQAKLPELNDAFAKSVGVADGTIDALRAEVRKNLSREVKFRLEQRNQNAVLNAVAESTTFDLPQSIVRSESQNLANDMLARFKQQGMDTNSMGNLPLDIFQGQAEKRVRIGLMVAALIEQEKLQATDAQIKERLNEIASSYENPAEMIKHMAQSPERLGQIQATVAEGNAVQFLLGKIQTSVKPISFEELMGQQAAE